MEEIDSLKQRVAHLEDSVNRYIRETYDEAHGFGCKPEDALVKSRKIAEAVSKQLLRLRGEDLPETITLNTLISKLQEKDKADKLAVPRQVITSLNNIRDRANQWCHEGSTEVPRHVLRSALSDLSYLVEFYFYDILGEKKSWWQSKSAMVLRHARSITVLGISVVISVTLLASVFILAIGLGIYRNFFSGRVRHIPSAMTADKTANERPDLFQMMAPKPAFIKIDSDPPGAWCWVYPQNLRMMMQFKKDEDQDENAMPVFGQTPFGRVSRSLSMMSAMGFGGKEKGIEAFVFKPGYEVKTVSIAKTTGDLDFGKLKLTPLNEAKAGLRTIKDLLTGSNSLAGTVVQLQGTIARVRENSGMERSLRSAFGRSDAEKTVEDMPSTPVFLSFGEPPFADALGLFVSRQEYEAAAKLAPGLAASEAISGRFTVYFPVTSSLNTKLLGHLRRVNGTSLRP